MYVYQRLRDLREDNDKTQTDIADLLNMSQTQYSRYERVEREEGNPCSSSRCVS